MKVCSFRFCATLTTVVFVSSLLVFAALGCASGTAITAASTPTTPVVTPPPTPTTPTPPQPQPQSVAYDAMLNHYFVANGPAGSVSVFDGSTNALLSTIAVGPYPVAVAVNQKTHMVYVGDGEGRSLTIINGTTFAVVNTLYSIASNPATLGVNSTTNKIYVLDFTGTPNVIVVDGSSMTVTDTLSVSGTADGIAINEQTNTLYISNGQTISVVDGATNTLTSILSSPFGTGAYNSLADSFSVAFDPTTNMIYVSAGGSANEITVIDGSTNIATASIPVPNDPGSLQVNPVTHLLYVAERYDSTNNGATKSVDVIDTVTNTVIQTIAMPQNPNGIAINVAANLVYVSADTSTFVINGATNTLMQ